MRVRRLALLPFFAILFAGCIPRATVDIRRQRDYSNGAWHRVGRGETLWSVSQRFSLPVKTVARANRISRNETLRTDRWLFLPTATSPRPKVAVRNRLPARAPVRTPAAPREARRPTPKAPSPALRTAPSPPDPSRLRFAWPTRGKVVSAFDADSNAGIDILASSGGPIRAAAEGRVVYTGLMRGYGNTVILQHDDGYLTVYAHTGDDLPPLDRTYRSGEPLCSLHPDGSFHFEVRKGRKPCNPLRFLPDAG